MNATLQSFAGRSTIRVMSMVAAVILLIAVAERLSPPQNLLWLLYLVPIGFATWYGGRRWGVAGTIASLLPVALWTDRYTSAAGQILTSELILRILLAVALVYFVDQARRSSERNRSLVRTDPSTGLANAKALFDLVSVERDRAERYSRPFTIAYIGIDNLPAVRLRAGSEAVEDVLRRLALQIRASIRSVDYVARLRDREFALLLPETDEDSATVVITRIRNVLKEALARERFELTFSIGAVTWRHSTMSVDTLHQRTYQLMYAARQDTDPVRHEVLEDLIAAASDPTERRRR